MKLGVFGFLISMGLGFYTYSAKPIPQITSCLKNSLIHSTPFERDEARLNCLRRHRSLDLATCTNEAQRMEYLLNEQVALKECYYSRSQIWNLTNCFGTAQKLHSLSDRDGMRLDCVAQMDLPKNRAKCLTLAQSFEQRQHKNRFVSVCLER